MDSPAWQSQDMAPSNPTGGISIPTGDVGMSNGPGIPPGDESWATSATSPRGRNGDLPGRRSRSKSPGARGGDDRGRGDSVGGNPGNNLHVSGLSLKVDTRDLEAAFAKVGRVRKASVMHDPHTRESRGFGFVEMETPEEAEAAINALNSSELFAKVITVEKARRNRARTPTPGRYHGPPKREGGERPYHPSYRDRGYERGYPPRGGYERDYYEPRRYDDYRRGGGGSGGGGGGGGRYDDGPRGWDDRRDYYGDRDRGFDRRY